MTPEELQPLFGIRGLVTRIKGNEVQVQNCLFCGNPKYNLEVNPVTGVYHCWACGARGRADKFIKENLGRDVHIQVNRSGTAIKKPPPNAPFNGPLKSASVLNYLTSRGLDEIDFNIYGVGEGVGDSVWEGRAVFPLWEYWSRECVGFMGRRVSLSGGPKYFSQWNDGTKYISGYRCGSEVHVLVEGSFDGIKVHKAGFNAVVLGGVTGTHVEQFAARVNQEHTLVVLLDGEAILEANRLFWTIFPIHNKTLHVRLPEGVDPGSLDPSILSSLLRRELSCSSIGPLSSHI